MQWLLLHHSLSSPLALLVEKTKNSEQERVMQSLLNAVKSSPVNPSIPRRDLFELNPHPDMFSVSSDSGVGNHQDADSTICRFSTLPHAHPSSTPSQIPRIFYLSSLRRRLRNRLQTTISPPNGKRYPLVWITKKEERRESLKS